MCRAHDGVFGGHNATHKTYLNISTSYFWPKMKQDIERHKNFDANNGRNLLTNGHHWHHFRFQIVQTSGLTLTSLAQ
jgi:hypothetical protein